MRTFLKNCRAVLVLGLLALAGCGPIAPPEEGGELIVAVRANPTTYFTAHSGELAGFEHDLLAAFARTHKLSLRWQEEDSIHDLFQTLSAGRAHLGAGALPRAVVRDRQMIAGSTLIETPVHIVVRADSRVRRAKDLKGKRVVVIIGSGHAPMMMRLKRKHPGISWAGLENAWPEELLSRLDDGDYDAVAINGLDFGALRSTHPGVRVAFDLPDKQSIVWALPPASSQKLRNDLARFIEAAQRDGTLAHIRERYFGHVKRLTSADIQGLIERRPKRLPALRAYFREAETLTGIDWRLLAAIGYQESQWNAFATSPTGVRGLMMLTGDTADRMGVANRLDARQSIIGGAKYLALMRDALPARIPEPDRTWLALAAYNQGQGHMEDARRIAQARGGSPDRWVDVKAALPHLGRGTYARVTRYGYARGAEALIFAENIRNYYDMLLRLEPGYDPLFGFGED